MTALSKQRECSATQPSDGRSLGLLIVSAGAIAIVVGLIVMRGGFGWFGHLPGDFRVERPNVRFYFPLGSMIVISIILSAISYLFRRFF